VAAKAAAIQPESLSTGPVTVPTISGSLPSILTTISTTPTSTPTDYGEQNSNQARNSSKVIAIAVALSSLAFLTVAGSGAWIFLHMRKKSRQGINKDDLDDPRYPGNALMSEHDTGPRMKLYVSGFTLPSDLFPDPH